MFKYNGKELENVINEYCVREIIAKKDNKEIKNNYLEFYIEGYDENDKINVDLLLNIEVYKLKLLDFGYEYDLNEYLIENECFFGVNKDFTEINLEDLNINIIKEDENKFNLTVDSYDFKFLISVMFILGEKNE